MSIALNSFGNGITSQPSNIPNLAEAPYEQGTDEFSDFSEILVSSLDASAAVPIEIDIKLGEMAEAQVNWKNLPLDPAVIAANFAVLSNMNANLPLTSATPIVAEGAALQVEGASTVAGALSAAFGPENSAALRQGYSNAVSGFAPQVQGDFLKAAAASAVSAANVSGAASGAQRLEPSVGTAVAERANGVATSDGLPGPVASTVAMVGGLDALASAEAGRIRETRVDGLRAERAVQAAASSVALQEVAEPVSNVAAPMISMPDAAAGPSVQVGVPAHREVRHAAWLATGEMPAPIAAADEVAPVEWSGVAEMASRLPVGGEVGNGVRSETPAHVASRAGSEMNAAFAGLLSAREAAQPLPTDAATPSAVARPPSPMTMDVEVLRLAANGGGRAVMELNPDSKDGMRIDLMLDGQGQARLIVEAPADANRARLEQDVQRLQSDFASLGLTLNVDVRDQREAPQRGMHGQQAGGFSAREDAPGQVGDARPVAVAAQAAAAGRVHIYA